MISFDMVLWHINHCRLFNAKSSLYIYILHIYGGACGVMGYRRRKRTRRHEFKSWTRLIAFHIARIPLVRQLV